MRDLLQDCDLGHLVEQGEASRGASTEEEPKSPLSSELLAPNFVRNHEFGRYNACRGCEFGFPGQSGGVHIRSFLSIFTLACIADPGAGLRESPIPW
jgi:hypothetical protein